MAQDLNELLTALFGDTLIVYDENFKKSLDIILDKQIGGIGQALLLEVLDDAIFAEKKSSAYSIGRALIVVRPTEKKLIFRSKAGEQRPFSIIISRDDGYVNNKILPQIRITNQVVVENNGRRIVCEIPETFTEHNDGRITFSKSEVSKFYNLNTERANAVSGIMNEMIESSSSAIASANTVLKNAGCDISITSDLFVQCITEAKQNGKTTFVENGSRKVQISWSNNGWSVMVSVDNKAHGIISFGKDESGNDRLVMWGKSDMKDKNICTFKSYTTKLDDKNKPYVEYLKNDDGYLKQDGIERV